MTDRYGEPDEPPYDEDAEEMDEYGQPLSRLTPSAREHLARAREALARPTDRRSA